jgi:hypothetical protein
MNSLRNHPSFETLARTSISVDMNRKEMIVRIPLGNPNGRPIPVSFSEVLDQAPNPSYGKPDSHGKVDNRATIETVQGPAGYKVLEAVFTKLLCEERGFGLTLDYAKTEGGFGGRALRLLFGGQYENGAANSVDNGTVRIDTVENFYDGVSLSKKPQEMAAMRQYLDSFDSGKDIAVINSLNLGIAGGHDNHYNIPGTDYRIYQTHAYSILGVDKTNGLVFLQNPWNAGNQKENIVLTYDQLFRGFSSISSARMSPRS